MDIKMTNKLFYTIIGSITLLCIVSAVFIRSSITEFKYEKINEISDTILYFPYDNIEYSNGTYVDAADLNNTDDLYRYIIKGKCTGNRKVVEGAVLTEIQVAETLKGNVNDKLIKIYEPISVDKNNISSFDGYNLIKDDKDYIFCLTDLKEGVQNYDDSNIKIYNYVTPFYGKFPIVYNDNDFIICDEDEDTFTYNTKQNYEQLFTSTEKKNQYFKEYNKLMKLQ